MEENESVELKKAKEKFNEAKMEFCKAVKMLGKKLLLVLSVYLTGGLLMMMCWNQIAMWFGFKCVSYIVGVCMFMLCRNLFGDRGESNGRRFNRSW